MSELHTDESSGIIDLPAWRLGLALWGGLALLDLTKALGASSLVQLLAVTALVVVCSVGVGHLTAACAAGIGWLLVNGFVVHELGQLGLVGVSDLLRAVLLFTVALSTAGVHR